MARCEKRLATQPSRSSSTPPPSANALCAHGSRCGHHRPDIGARFVDSFGFGFDALHRPSPGFWSSFWTMWETTFPGNSHVGLGVCNDSTKMRAYSPHHVVRCDVVHMMRCGAYDAMRLFFVQTRSVGLKADAYDPMRCGACGPMLFLFEFEVVCTNKSHCYKISRITNGCAWSDAMRCMWSAAAVATVQHHSMNDVEILCEAL